jgi:hypothetical protein
VARCSLVVPARCLTLATRQLAHDIPQVVHNLLTLLRRKCPCEFLDRPAAKHLDLRHQPRELVLILWFFGVRHAPHMVPKGNGSSPVSGNIFRPRPAASGLAGIYLSSSLPHGRAGRQQAEERLTKAGQRRQEAEKRDCNASRARRMGKAGFAFPFRTRSEAERDR